MPLWPPRDTMDPQGLLTSATPSPGRAREMELTLSPALGPEQHSCPSSDELKPSQKRCPVPAVGLGGSGNKWEGLPSGVLRDGDTAQLPWCWLQDELLYPCHGRHRMPTRLVPSQVPCPHVPATLLLQAGTPPMDAGGPSAARQEAQRSHRAGAACIPGR